MFAIPPGFAALRGGTPTPLPSLFGFGYSLFGNLLGTTRGIFYPDLIRIGASISGISQLCAKDIDTYHIIKSDGTLWAWGSATIGQLGDGTQVNKQSPVQIGVATDWAQITHGQSAQVLGLRQAAPGSWSLWTWGNGASGILGKGNTSSFSAPTQVGALTDWKQVAAGGTNSGAIKTDGTLWMWGLASVGQIGDGQTATNRSSPVQVGTLTDWAQLSIGTSHSAAVKTNGTLYTWGLGTSGQLGDGSAVSKSSPVQVGTLTDWAYVSAGDRVTIAVKSDGTLWAFGNAGNGQLGNNTTTPNKSSPVQIGTATDWLKVMTQVPANGSTGLSYAVKTDGTLYSWGNASGIDLGYTVASASAALVPAKIGIATNWTEFAGCGVEGMMALNSAGELWGCGKTSAYNFLDEYSYITISPVLVHSANWAMLSMGRDFVVGIKSSDGKLYGWGKTDDAQLTGASNQTSFATAFTCNSARLIDVNTWDWVAASDARVHAIRGGALYAWGSGSSTGAMGTADAVDKSSVVQVGTQTDWVKVFGGGNNTYAIKTNGALYSWGGAAFGMLGNNSVAANVSSPVQVGTNLDWSFIAHDASTAISLKTDGTLWTWGTGSNGARASNNLTNTSSPIQVGTLTDWARIAIGAQTGAAVKSNGTLWTWGVGTAGQLGDSSSVTKSSPVQVGTLTDWAQVAVGNSAVYAVKTDGTLWSWGYNGNGQLGHSGTTNRSSPVQIGTLTTWLNILANRDTGGTFGTIIAMRDP